jgi:hypothetical protein
LGLIPFWIVLAKPVVCETWFCLHIATGNIPPHAVVRE